MADITLRQVKGSPLTIEELDTNFINMNNDLGTKLSASSYTASDLLSKLLTVDGSTSGLDADLLDGYNTSVSSENNTIPVRSSTGVINATGFVGSLTGNVTGNLVGNVTGSVTGNVTGSVIGDCSGTSSNVTGIVTIPHGGTGASDITTARSNLGLGSLSTKSTVSLADMAINSVGTSQIVDLNITTGKINDLAVTSGKIADLAVTTGKINDLAVTTGKINNLAVTSGKIADSAITASKLNGPGNGTSGQYLQSDGDGSFTWNTPVGYTGPKLDIFTTSGTWTVPNGVTTCKVFVIGGGGGGQVGYAGTNGKSGGSVQAYVTGLTSGSNIAVTVGQGGAYQNGTGGTSSFGSYATGTGGGGRTGSSGSGSVGSSAVLLTRGDNGSTSDAAAYGGLLYWIEVAPFRANVRSESNGFSRVEWSLTSTWNPGAGGASANNSNGTFTCAGVDGVVIVEY